MGRRRISFGRGNKYNTIKAQSRCLNKKFITIHVNQRGTKNGNKYRKKQVFILSDMSILQGFDLNFAGVILGPSVKYRNGKIVFDPAASCNVKATRNRTLSDGSKQKFGETLIQHEVRVLMTRGVEGLYIYACDKELREALLQSTI